MLNWTLVRWVNAGQLQVEGAVRDVTTALSSTSAMFGDQGQDLQNAAWRVAHAIAALEVLNGFQEVLRGKAFHCIMHCCIPW